MILVTGASGQLATLILDHLTHRGVPVLGASRTPRAGDRAMDFDRPASIDLTGVDTLVLISAGYAEDDVVIARHRAVLEAARRDGVGHVVYTSLIGEGDHLGFALAHRVTEQMLTDPTDGGPQWTILRNGLYAELVGGLLTREDGALRSPFGDGAVAAPTREDLALCAVEVALSPRAHRGRVYELTGPAFTAAQLGAAMAVPVRDLGLEAYRARLAATPGLAPFQGPMLVSIASSIRHGLLAHHHGDLAGLLGREPVPGLEAARQAIAP
ncbi:MAG: NmrA family transcriptional regulator [Actinomyces bowdenii]|nr:NmrA family transcriptional regulator [Actinomyces bowdenii]